MKTFFITFSAKDFDKHGHSLDKCYTIVNTENEDNARDQMLKKRGKNWAFIYPNGEAAGVTKYNLQYIPFRSL